MIQADHRYHLDVAPALAFDYIANPAHDAQWQSSCLEAQLLDPVPTEGARYRIVFSFMGRRTAFMGEITQRTPHSEYAFRVHEGPFHYDGRYSFRPSGAGVDVHWQFQAEPGRHFGIVPASLLRKVLVSQVERDVVALRRHFAAAAVPRPLHTLIEQGTP